MSAQETLLSGAIADLKWWLPLLSRETRPTAGSCVPHPPDVKTDYRIQAVGAAAERSQLRCTVKPSPLASQRSFRNCERALAARLGATPKTGGQTANGWSVPCCRRQQQQTHSSHGRRFAVLHTVTAGSADRAVSNRPRTLLTTYSPREISCTHFAANLSRPRLTNSLQQNIP